MSTLAPPVVRHAVSGLRGVGRSALLGSSGTALLCVALTGAAAGASLVDVRVGEHPGYTRVVLELDAPVAHELEGTGEAGSLTVRVRASAEPRTLRPAAGVVAQIEVRPEPTGGSRAEIATRGPVVVRRELRLSDPPRIVLDLARRTAGTPAGVARGGRDAGTTDAPTGADASGEAETDRGDASAPPESSPASSPWTAERLEALGPEEFRAVPYRDVAAVLGLGAERAVVALELGLLDLRYYLRAPTGRPSPELDEAVRRFQRDLGHDPTGELRFGEFEELRRRMAALHPKPVHPLRFRFEHLPDHVRATGTWHGSADAPLQATELRCVRAWGACVEATATLAFGEEHSVLGARSRRWEIERWSARGLVALRREDCEEARLHVRFEEEVVRETRTPLDAASCAEAAHEGTFSRELVDGTEAALQHFRRRWEAANLGYSASFGSALGTALPGRLPPGGTEAASGAGATDVPDED